MKYKHTLIIDNYLFLNTRVDVEFKADDEMNVTGILSIESSSVLSSDDLFNLEEWLEQDVREWVPVLPFQNVLQPTTITHADTLAATGLAVDF